MALTQNEDTFVGVYLLKGDYHKKKGDEKVKGKLNDNAIDEVFLKDVDPITVELYWIPNQGSLSKEGNVIVIKHIRESKGGKDGSYFVFKKETKKVRYDNYRCGSMIMAIIRE